MSCSWCKGPASTQCSKCKAVLYCSKKHQLYHFALHKESCNGMKRAYKTLDFEEKKLRKFQNGDPFVMIPGIFGFFPFTTDYLLAQAIVIKYGEEIGTDVSLTIAVEHAMTTLHLSHIDRSNIRDLAPGLMLRINREQKCYDFIKWWLKHGDPYGDYDWRNPSLPFLDIRNANMFEPLHASLSHVWRPTIYIYSAMMLIKFRLFSAVKEVQSFDSFLLGELRCTLSLHDALLIQCLCRDALPCWCSFAGVKVRWQ